MKVVADASALAAVIFEEDGASEVRDRLQGASIWAPELLKLELANTALKKARRNPERAPEIFARLGDFKELRRGIQWHDVHPVDVAILASLTGLSAYDASDLCLAGWLEADLVTLDRRLAAVKGMATEAAD